MRRYLSGDKVPGGFYLNRREWDITLVKADGDQLPGATGQTHVRVPAPAMLLVAPFLGLLLIMFLPFVGIGMLLMHLGRSALRATRAAVEHLMATVSPTWRPGMAFLAGEHRKGARQRRGEEPGSEEPGARSEEQGAAGELETLGREIADKRQKG